MTAPRTVVMNPYRNGQRVLPENVVAQITHQSHGINPNDPSRSEHQSYRIQFRNQSDLEGRTNGEQPDPPNNMAAIAALIAAANDPSVRNVPINVHQNQNRNNRNQNRQEQDQPRHQPPTQNPTSPQIPGRIRIDQTINIHTNNEFLQPVPVRPLEEQPYININPDEGAIPPIDKDVECPICYEVVDRPASCGSCAARFCFDCLKRAVGDSNSCPSCRKEIRTVMHIQPDFSFYTRLNKTGKQTRQCTYPNCGKVLHLSIYREHERSCEYKPMKCKYAAYGCIWKGARKDLEAHYNVGCTLAKMSPLIEELRRTKADHARLVNVLNSRFMEERRALAQMRSHVANFQLKNPNWLETFHMIYSVTCSPLNFMIKGMVWRSFWNCAGTRAAVNNFVCLVPLTVWILKQFIIGLKYLSVMLDGPITRDTETDSTGKDENSSSLQEIYFTEMLLHFFTGILGIVMMTCFVSTSIYIYHAHDNSTL